MKTIQLATALVASCLVVPAFAAITSTTYTFTDSNQTVNSQSLGNANGGTAAYNGGYAGYNSASGTNYGNWRTFKGLDGSTVKVTAWASTGALLNGGTTGYDRAIQSAYGSQYQNGGSQFNELGETSRQTTNTSGAANNELSSCGSGSTSCKTVVPEHAVDNMGTYEALEFTFQSAVTLGNVGIGYPSGTSPDSDATVLAYTGCTGCSATLGGTTARTFADLLNNGWTIAGNLKDLAATGSGSLSTTVKSQYWLVGAYMDIGSNKTGGLNSTYSVGNDAIKLSSLTVNRVPEPSSLALFGIAIGALALRRRQGRRS